jgi:hypothetical protein
LAAQPSPPDRHTASHPPVRLRPAFLRALGAEELPSQVVIGGRAYRLVRSFKHDSWAASALYADGDERIVCKFNRCSPILGLPMRWLGRRLARREALFLEVLADLPQVPLLLGPVTVGGQPWPHAVAHRYVPGHPLGRLEPVGEGFFEELAALIGQMHRRGVAYVDLHKRENIIVGDDGRPHLVDFQICYLHPHSWLGRVRPMRSLFAVLRRSDQYHLTKHTMRHRLRHVSEYEREAAINALRPTLHRFIRAIGNRLRGLRRGVLVALKVRAGVGLAHTERDPEEGVLRDHRPKQEHH